MIAYSIIKSVPIDAPASEVFEFLADLSSWPQGAVVHIKALVPADGEWWDLKTAVGGAKMRLRADAASRVLDHDFDDTQTRWSRWGRQRHGLRLGDELFQPLRFSQAAFQRDVALVDEELARLKMLMASRVLA